MCAAFPPENRSNQLCGMLAVKQASDGRVYCAAVLIGAAMGCLGFAVDWAVVELNNLKFSGAPA